MAEKFDDEYDQVEYEKKIARLIRHARSRARREDREEFDAWSDAIRTLRKEDHCLLVMIDQAGTADQADAAVRADAAMRPRGDLLKLVGTALAVVCLLLLLPFARIVYDFELTEKSLELLALAMAACVAGAYVLACIFLGRQRTSRFVLKLLGFPDWRK